MRTVLYCHTSIPGGAELAAPALCQQLAADMWIRGEGHVAEEARRRRVSVDVLNSSRDKRPKSLLELLVTVIQIFVVQYTLTIKLARERPEVLISNTIQGLLHVAIPAIITRTCLIVYVRDLGFGGNRNWIETRVLQLLAETCRGAVFNSDFTRQSWKIHKPHIVVPTAINPEFYDVCRSLGKSKVIMVGRLAKWKGQVEAVKAMEIVHQTHPLSLTIIGGSLFGDAIVLPEHSFPLNATSHVEDPWMHMRDADLFVHASLTPEPFGQVLAQAAAAGVPIVCSNRGGHMEWLDNDVSCLAADPLNTEDFAKAIRCALDERDSSAARADVARKRAECFREAQAYAPLREWLSVLPC